MGVLFLAVLSVKKAKKGHHQKWTIKPPPHCTPHQALLNPSCHTRAPTGIFVASDQLRTVFGNLRHLFPERKVRMSTLLWNENRKELYHMIRCMLHTQPPLWRQGVYSIQLTHPISCGYQHRWLPEIYTVDTSNWIMVTWLQKTQAYNLTK